MAIITAALLTALNTGLGKNFRDAYKSMREESFFAQIATTVPSSSTSNTYGWLGDFPSLQEWVGDRVVKDMAAHGYQITNKLYEATVGVKRTAIEDDQFGHYRPMVEHMGQEAAVHPDRMLSALLAAGITQTCYDGQYFFDVDHPVAANADGTGAVTTVSNYDDGGVTPGPMWFLLDTRKALKPFIFQERTKPEFESKTNPATSDNVFTKDEYQYGIRYRCNAGFGFWQMAWGSKAPLNAANFEAARTAMRKFQGDGGRPLGINPNMLLVPADLESAADVVVNVRDLAGGGSNPNYNKAKVIVSSWLG